MNLEIKMATMDNVNDIITIYQSLIGYPGCTWSEEYPTKEDVKKDIKKKSLYVVYDKKRIIAVAAAGQDDELQHLECWNQEIRFPCDLARIGVIKEYQNKGIAKQLVRYIEKDAKNRGFDGIHFLVSKTNPKALALYDNLKYHYCGETIMYEIEWFCYEKNLK